MASEDGRPGPLVIGGAASLGAGAIHVAAIGAHAEHPAAVAVFAALAAAQLAIAALALARPTKAAAAVLAAVSLGAFAGWAIAKAAGIPFIDGLDEREPVQLADGIAAGLAVVALFAGAARFAGAPLAGLRSPVAVAVGAAVGVLAIPGVVTASTHRHAGDEPAAAHPHAGDVAEAAHTEPAVLPPKPYDPMKPIDLSGVEGVTPEQQAKAENLISVTLLRLPRFADPVAAEAVGFRSIGDGLTGYEHFVNWSWIDDDKILDPDFPESLVYRVVAGQRTLEAAMYMLPRGRTLNDVPTDIGGPLVQWHIHNNLCYTPDPAGPRVAGLTEPDGTCRPPLVEGPRVPMVHVWIVPHRCGPFAALEGVGAGQIREGETRLCDHAHGASA